MNLHYTIGEEVRAGDSLYLGDDGRLHRMTPDKTGIYQAKRDYEKGELMEVFLEPNPDAS